MKVQVHLKIIIFGFLIHFWFFYIFFYFFYLFFTCEFDVNWCVNFSDGVKIFVVIVENVCAENYAFQ